MIDTKQALTWLAVLAVATTAWGYEDREKDEARIQEAIKEGIIDSHPFPPVDPWGDWVNNCGDMLSYRSLAISHWQEVAEATDMTAEQRAKAEALKKQFREAHEAFDEATTPPKDKLKARSEEAKRAGKHELADKLKKLVYVQAHYKLAIQGGASEDLLRLLTPEQLKAWHEYRVTKHGRDKMTHKVYRRSVHGEDLNDALNLTGEQKQRIQAKAWQISREDFLPTVKHPENVGAFGVHGERGKRAEAMGDQKLYPWMVENVLTDMQRAKLAFADQRWHVTALPTGGAYTHGEKVNVELSVQTDGQTKGAQIRYTLDGSPPTADSQPYRQPLAITQDTTLRARCFLDGKLLPGRTAKGRYVFLGDDGPSGSGLRHTLYRGTWEALPSFADLKPAGRGVASGINLEVDGLGGEFGLVFAGLVEVPTSGEYTFFVTSDDGSALYINGQKVVDNDGTHGPRQREGTVALAGGFHLIRVEYFDAGGGRALQVHWQGPGIDKQPIPTKVLTHRPGVLAAEGVAGGMDHYRVHTGKWFVMKDGEFTLATERPDLPAEELRWRAWAAAHRINKGPYWPYDAVRDHGKILEHIEATPQQKRTIDEIVRIAREGGEVFEHETKPRYRQLGDLEQGAKQAGDKAKADRYRKMKHVQVSSKLALQRAPFFEILSLLTDDQWDAVTKAIPKYQKLRDGMRAMKKALADVRQEAN